MLLFSTILEFKESLTKEAFIQLVIDWNQGSPHKDNIIQNLEWKGERNIRFGEANLWMAIEEYRNEDIIAVRFEKREPSGTIWNTDYVANFQTMKMAIRLDRSYAEDAVAADTNFSTPFFITHLIEKGYVKNDGALPILSIPIIIDHNNLEVLADVINSDTRYKLPIVYVSKTEYNENPVDVNELAKSLKGVAHVLVQKSTGLNRRIMPLCDKKNEFNGAIGIY